MLGMENKGSLHNYVTLEGGWVGGFFENVTKRDGGGWVGWAERDVTLNYKLISNLHLFKLNIAILL